MPQTINLAGSDVELSLAPAIPFDATNRHAPAAATAAVVTLAADASRPNILSQIHCGYTATPTGGAITVEDGAGTTVWSLPLAGAGPYQFDFDPPLCGTRNTAMIITLASGAGAVVGTLNVNAYKAL